MDALFTPTATTGEPVGISEIDKRESSPPNAEYLFLRSKVFHLKSLHYLAIDTLLIALEFGEDEKIFVLLSEIYSLLGNHDLSKRILDKNLRAFAMETLKDSLKGIYRKNEKK